MQKHRNIPAYRELIDSGFFELAVVTTFESKAKRLREELAEQTSLADIPLRVHAVPELIEFIAPPPLCTSNPFMGFKSPLCEEG